MPDDFDHDNLEQPQMGGTRFDFNPSSPVMSTLYARFGPIMHDEYEQMNLLRGEAFVSQTNVNELSTRDDQVKRKLVLTKIELKRRDI